MATHSDPRLLDTAQLEAVLAEFARVRDWDRHHTPRNLLLALTGEVGELVEIFQWKPDAQAEGIMNTDEAEHVRQEVADVFLYLMRLVMVLGIDLDDAVRKKIALNAIKYPPKTEC
ncbi:MAG: nucleotide pyrophosphohydrolase [Candidatus Dactylopiibacterium carminicum]|uniref:Nucleotide pyrophosphohydrolase n=1 Tax=Candidatus Dactylopiibacterium carminicum TaxID=857335 RepID=A0A272EZ33_9RHOO|nr:nucleotide pyrophosphohydrolase [Candidatus Dactylopiibacterium carminicum]KAF7600885.1 nucleotide pyrophosphohydrolase [Candidatus Dactylopiibacterium carminicum]PAS95384.1 MAG: nucleotide pyrophosphohydrolase [Candidatus Dactylopiibacterium carminicum]PAS98605.1 MAG: nucleotide pyrophosphohydrolase [Candidatus Dactylopiibacterium carminicum]PAT00883.1 MAG: nucleotide pyrophosphohydrolase [Candidatus Dactylopiibacterium carminicum]